jgi:hypothetical protein
MKPMMLFGLILLIVGILALGYQGVAYVTTRDTVVQAGPFSIQADREHAIPLWPIASGVCLVGGVILLAASSWRRTT